MNKRNIVSISARCTKVTLFHIDGKTSNMFLTFPNYTAWGDPCELSVIYMKEFAFSLTKSFINISAIEIEMGYLDKNGKYDPGSISPMRYEVPLDKIYNEGSSGEWITVKEAKERYFKTLAASKNTGAQGNDFVYN